MKTKFEEFIQKALKKPEQVTTIQSSNDYLNHQTQVAVDTEINKSKKVKSFIKMGIVASLIAVPMLSMAHGSHDAPQLTTSKYQTEMQETVKKVQNKGYIQVNPELKIKEINYSGTRYDAFIPGVENHYDGTTTQSQCDITLTFSKKGHTVFMAQDDALKTMTDPQNDAQTKLTREFILLHEASHCELNATQDVFVVKGNPELQKNVNYFFKNMMGTEQSDSAYHLLHENFADTYAAMQLINMYGNTADVMKVINNVSLERHNVDLSTQSKVDSHYTHFSLVELLKPDNVNKIKKLNPQELKQFALEVANHGTNTVLSTYSDALPEMFEQSAMVKSALMNFNVKSMRDFFNPNAGDGKMAAVSKTTPTYFEQLGVEVFQDAKIERVSHVQLGVANLSNDQFNKAKDIAETKFKAKYEHDFSKLDKVTQDYLDYITTNFKPQLDQKTTGATMESKLAEMKTQMIEDYKSREKAIVPTSFFDKISVFKNMESLRAEADKNSKTSSLNMN